jgi:crotonobetainyl-CoA:carnitine CoA-transferase CaiB-like acyl-CoA transferase
MQNLQALIETLAPYFKLMTTAEVLERMAAAGVPVGPVLSVSDMHHHPQTLARNMVPHVDHPVAGRMQTLGLPVKFSETPGGVQHAAPLFGQHTREVLAGYGYAASEIEALVKNAAVRDAG